MNCVCVCDRYAGWLLSVGAGTAARDDGPHEQRHDVARVQPALVHPTPGGAHDAGHSHAARWLHAPAAHSSGPAVPCFSKVSTTCHSSSLIHPGECYMPQQFPDWPRWVLHATAVPWFTQVSATCHSSSLLHPGECYMPQQFPASPRWVLHTTAVPWFTQVSATCHSSSLIHPGECYTP